MSVRTPWSQSSLLSDRVKPKNQSSASQKSKGKGKEPAGNGAPKSPAVRNLEDTIKKLQNESGQDKDPKGGCFCLARTHKLHPYVPICTRCGLILCLLNAPYYACPHCSAPLLMHNAKKTLLDRLRDDLASTIAKEEEDVERTREEARQIAGAFPSLGSANVNPGGQQQQLQILQQPQAHKVLSLNSKTKRVTVASYTTPPLSRSPAQSPVPERDPSPERVPPLPEELPVAREAPNPRRPWLDVRGDGFVRTLTYVRDPRADRKQLKEGRKARKASKKEDARRNDEGQDARAEAAAIMPS